MMRTLPSQNRQDNRLNRDLPVCYLMTDKDRLPDPAAMVPHLPPFSAIILRDIDKPRQNIMAQQLAPLCRSQGVYLIESHNTAPTSLTADGLHIPEKSLSQWTQTDIIRLQPSLLTTSAHSLRSLNRAAHFGADACFYSPVFETKSHPGATSLGMPRFAAICRHAQVPVIALGGISAHNVSRVLLGGAAGIAGIGLFTEFMHKSFK